jgi:hypothetical protein
MNFWDFIQVAQCLKWLSNAVFASKVCSCADDVTQGVITFRYKQW